MTARLSIRLDDELNDHLTAITHVLGITKNALIKDLLETHVIKLETNQDYIAKRDAWNAKVNSVYGA